MLAAMRSEPPFDPAAGGRLVVDRSALVANWRRLAARAAPGTAAAVVKADAYGTGIAAAVPALAAAGCDTFFAAVPAEGIAVRAAAPAATIYVLGGFAAGCGALYRAHRLRPVLGCRTEIADWLAEVGEAGEPPALHVDTGMSRLGLPVEEAAALAGDRAVMDRLAPALVMSHLACADRPEHPMNAAQTDAFAAVRRSFPGVPGSLANSAGLMLLPETVHDLARPGIALYGGAFSGRAPTLATVATLEARIVQLRTVAAGVPVGYGATFVTRRPSRIAVLGVGYADGYPRRAGAMGVEAAVDGRRVPIAGTVSMDLVAVDVTDLPDGAARRGGRVELFGPTVAVDEVAARCGTIGYELLTQVGARIQRVYV